MESSGRFVYDECMGQNEIYLALSQCAGIGPKRLDLLLEIFGDVDSIWSADRERYSNQGLKGSWVDVWLNFRKDFRIENLIKQLKMHDVRFVGREDSGYPKSLVEIEGAPIGLYVKGYMEKLDDVDLLAVVGTRKITDYGKRVTRDLTRDLVGAGMGIVSGLMYGVDEAAHRACIEHGGFTVGVWAGGLDTLMGGTRGGLARDILRANGVLLSEYRLGMKAHRLTFPARNRIVSGLSRGVLVTEGSKGSGTLITAGFAASQGKEVFAVPGPITSVQSAAPTELLKMGAVLVSSAEDVSRVLGVRASGRPRVDVKDLDQNEQEVWNLLRNEPLTIDDLCRDLNWNVGVLSSVLLMMELKKVIVREGDRWSCI